MNSQQEALSASVTVLSSSTLTLTGANTWTNSQTFTNNVVISGSLTVSGTFYAEGVYRQTIGPWQATAIAASLTNGLLGLSGISAIAAPSTWNAWRSGSIVNISTQLTINATGQPLTVKVFKEGVDTGIVHQVAVGTLRNTGSFARGTYKFNPNDRLDIRLSTPLGWLSLTAGVIVWLEVET